MKKNDKTGLVESICTAFNKKVDGVNAYTPEYDAAFVWLHDYCKEKCINFSFIVKVLALKPKYQETAENN